MTTGQIFTKWDETHSELWSHQPIRLEHEMHKSPAFSMDDLAKLIESYPREHYSLVQTGAKGSSRVWREGDIGNLSRPRGDRRDLPRRALAQHARRRRRRQPLSQAGRQDVRGNPRQGAGLRNSEGPSGKHPDLRAGRAGLLSRRLAGPGPGSDRRPQARLCLSELRAVHHAGTSRGHRAVQCRSRYALQGMVRRSRQGARHRPRPDAELADERAAPGREPRHLQRLDDDLLYQ